MYDFQNNFENSAVEARARRAANRVGLSARKSRLQHPLDNQGGFMLVDTSNNVPVAGYSYDLTAGEVIECCQEYEDA
ncbi:MAG: hypothetical protein O7A62_09105 [Alphaproteobacteria bacterium]|nr:hypothetical protein [Alphaproteobacteria bacterium]